MKKSNFLSPVHKIFILFFIIACSTQLIIAQQVDQTISISKKIDSARALVINLLKTQKIPGLSITVMQNGKIVWSEGFGYADLENMVPVNSSTTRFRIGSVSKTLTADALAVLYEDGKLNLDAIIQTYVPYFPVKKYPITVRQVAGHIAGIHHYLNESQFHSAKRYNSVKESLDIFKDDSLLFEPGTKYTYSTYGWNLLSAVIEGVSGTSYLEFMQRNVFDRLGMLHTSADKNDSIISGRTRFYQLNKDTQINNAIYVDNSNKWAGGGFISTSEDIALFASAHCRPGFLKASTLELFTTSQKLSDGKATGYGIGWGVGKEENIRSYYGHTGGSVGGITLMRVYPKEQFVIAILTNSSDADPFRTGIDIGRIFMNGIATK